MKKQTYPLIAILLLVMLAAFQACSFPGRASDGGPSAEDLAKTMVVQTQTALAAIQDPGAPTPTDSTAPQAPTATETQPPVDTPTPTLTLTLTPEAPMVTVSVDTNCRSGPGKIYNYVGALLVGEKAEVVGQSLDGQYWIIKNPDQAGECWLWANYAATTGPVAALPKYTPPPTPTPSFVWAGTWTSYSGTDFLVVDTMTVTVDGKAFTGVINLGGGDTLILSGTISDNDLSVHGTYQGPVVTGVFNFFALGANQFQGNGDTDEAFAGEMFAWCGGRGGAGMPSPCLKE
jgi:hypothetical protein